MTFLILGYALLTIAYSQCGPWTVTNPEDGSQVTLDLTCLQGHTFDAVDTDSEPHHYHYSVCSNGQSCKGDGVMVQQTVPSDTATCYIIGRWDSNKEPEFENINGGTWTFVYDNGDDDCGNPARTWSPKYVCDASTNYEIGNVNEIPNPGSCFYEVEIKTKYACTGQTFPCFEEDGSSGLSGGWLFIIIFVGAVFLYCVVGYIIMGTTVNKAGGLGDFSNNIPQKTLWVALPSLVIAGCCYTKDAIMGAMNRGGGGDMDKPIVTDTDQ
eukprot:400293_1